MTDKTQLRHSAKAMRAELARQFTPARAKALEDALLHEILSLKPQVVGVYMPIQDECPLGDVPYHLTEASILLSLPVVIHPEQPMVFRQWDVNGAVTSGIFGIGVPDEKAPVLKPDIVLVPLLAYDRHGHRLGYGQGCYDRTLPELRKTKPARAIGVAYEGQQVDKLPTDVHDMPLDAVVTPAGIERFDAE